MMHDPHANALSGKSWHYLSQCFPGSHTCRNAGHYKQRLQQTSDNPTLQCRPHVSAGR